MRENEALTRNIARRLSFFAAAVLPSNRTDWAKAMVNELEHISDDHAALKWAIGCLFTSIIARVKFMVGMGISIRQAAAIMSLSVVALSLVFGGVLAAEAVSVSPLALYLGNNTIFSGTLLAVAILSLTLVPMAYLTGYGLRLWVPALSGRMIPVVAVFWTLSLVWIQVYVLPVPTKYTILKILVVVIPLVLGGYRRRPGQAT